LTGLAAAAASASLIEICLPPAAENTSVLWTAALAL
jgi:hypothetical protein